MSSPDPSVQKTVITSFVTKLPEADAEFAYRLNAYTLAKKLQRAVTQPQVDELWRYLVAEAREVHGVKHETSKKMKASEPSGSKPSEGWHPRGEDRDRQEGRGPGGA